MASRFAELTHARIESAPDQISADCLRGKLAAYLVRQGHREEASIIMRELHARYDQTPVAAVSAWMNLVEGLEFAPKGEQRAAHDKIQRAHALSTAAGLRPMRALSAGWLANLKFGSLEIEGMILRLIEALEHAAVGDHQALARACLVAAVALHLAGRYDLAKTWYVVARNHAAAESDESTVSALMHNQTCMGVANLRQVTLTGVGGARSAPDPLLEAESTMNYDGLVGTVSASTWAPILKAQAAALNGRPAQALQIYEEHLDASKAQGMGRVLCYMYADIAWCYLQVGSNDKSLDFLQLAEGSFQPSTLVDDRAAAHSRLASVTNTLGRRADSQRHAELAAESWAEFSKVQASIVGGLERIQVPSA
jgi:tetratricopeptide (TPR) repeat protein